MNPIVCITLAGLPKRVHQIADALDQMVPDTFEWHDAKVARDGFEILLEGVCIRDVMESNRGLVLQSASA